MINMYPIPAFMVLLSFYTAEVGNYMWSATIAIVQEKKSAQDL